MRAVSTRLSTFTLLRTSLESLTCALPDIARATLALPNDAFPQMTHRNAYL
jgi:hypothetical protein